VFVLVWLETGLSATEGEGVTWQVLECAVYLAWAVLPAGFGTFLQAPGNSSSSAVVFFLFSVQIVTLCKQVKKSSRAMRPLLGLGGGASRLWHIPASTRKQQRQCSRLLFVLGANFDVVRKGQKG
jgi:hypothetical protein